uniref:Phosphatidate cytidylyltransferase n=1 Tax=Eutreptiella gymnastica TaxID=73025 RepID=A0A7S1N6Q7_9EUGL|mmetsp:Transcript_130282/g.225249  ORF Transcript_130282/g.225249 Transcript_130282/m.225249 type:complete len:556 (+) Transcript_130282:29-1696(+)
MVKAGLDTPTMEPTWIVACHNPCHDNALEVGQHLLQQPRSSLESRLPCTLGGTIGALSIFTVLVAVSNLLPSSSSSTIMFSPMGLTHVAAPKLVSGLQAYPLRGRWSNDRRVQQPRLPKSYLQTSNQQWQAISDHVPDRVLPQALSALSLCVIATLAFVVAVYRRTFYKASCHTYQQTMMSVGGLASDVGGDQGNIVGNASLGCSDASFDSGFWARCHRLFEAIAARDPMRARPTTALSANAAGVDASGGPKPIPNKYLRIITALSLASVWIVAAINGGYFLGVIMGITALIGVREYFAMVKVGGKTGGTTITTACAFGFPIIATYAPYRFSLMLPMAATTICVYLVAKASMSKIKPESYGMYTFSTAIFGLFYMAYLPAYWIRLRGIPHASGLSFAHLWPTFLGGPEQVTMGFAFFVGTVLCIVAADSMAYVVGKAVGKTKFTNVSPNKTVEGALGGLTACCGVAVAMALNMNWPLWYLTGPVFGTMVFFASLFGDLAESLMKRDAGVKDSGDVLPGHGGILDRFDSYLFTAPLVYYFVQFLLVPLMGLGPWSP